MNATELRTFIKEKGYEPSKIYALEDGGYSILVMKDWPKSEREPRRWFEAPTITELFYEVQRAL